MFYKGKLEDLDPGIVGTGTIQPLYNGGNGNARKQLATGIVYKSADGKDSKVLTLCSENYMLLQNSVIIKEVKETFPAEAFVTVKEYMGTMFLSVFESKKLDEFSPGILLKNSMDGRIQYTAEPALIKLVCSNGATATQFMEGRKKIMHLEKNRGALKGIMEMMEEGIEKFLESYKKLDRISLEEGKLNNFIKRLQSVRLQKYLNSEEVGEITTAQELYDHITYFASNKKDYDWEIISAANQVFQFIPA